MFKKMYLIGFFFQEKQIAEAAEGWEYAPLFNLKFHATERTMDMVRRRRWHRKMVCEKKGADCFFVMKFEVLPYYSDSCQMNKKVVK